jgi:putative oxidoreductase
MRTDQHAQGEPDDSVSRVLSVETERSTPRRISGHTFALLARWMLLPPATAPRATVLIRMMAGGVFLSEGILKFVYTNQGVGRFTKLGFALPELTATAIASLEIVGGLLLLAGLLTRVMAFTFVIEMIVAVLSTKVALYFGTSPLPSPPSPPTAGAWAVLHESRSDYAQLLSCLFLFVAGSGPWSLDAHLERWWRAIRALLSRAQR